MTSEAGGLLDSLGASLDSLSTLTAPIHSRATALTVAQRNIAATKGEVDALLEHLGTPRRVAAALQAGPASDLAAFLEGLEALERSVAFLQRHARLAAVEAALGYAQAVFNRALETCHADFAATLAEATRMCAPQPSWVAGHLGDALNGAAERWDVCLQPNGRVAVHRRLLLRALFPGPATQPPSHGDGLQRRPVHR